MSVAVYPGSFDPITLGHIDIVTRAARLFDRIIMAVVNNPSKTPFLATADRMQLLKEGVSHLDNVEVESFEGLTVNFAKAKKANIIIRGLRAVSDFEYEFKMSQMNKTLNPKIETIFMMASLEYQFMSSSLVQEVSRFGGDISQVVPPEVIKHLESHKSSV